MKTSGLVIVSDGERLCYPYIESIKSFLPVVNEMVVVVNAYGSKDGSTQKIEAIRDDKVRVIRSYFDLDDLGWVSYGIARTTGYQACTGDCVLMFDADGILHEKDQQKLTFQIHEFMQKDEFAFGYWLKNRIYTPTRYWDQSKHSGIYNKRLLQDRFDFYRSGKKGAPNFDRVPIEIQRAKQFSIKLFGYEHIWDTKEVVTEKIVRYSRMIDKQQRNPIQTDKEYIRAYMHEMKQRLNEQGKTLSLMDHPAIIQSKIRSVTEEHFGHNFFNW